MNERWILVDGYSVLHFWPRLRKLAGRSLQQQRDALLSVLRQYGDATARRITVVFDGYAAKHKPEQNEPTPGLEVIFSTAGKTADDVIERLVATTDRPGNITVITSDNLERQTVETLGANSLSCELFEREITDALGELARLVREHSRPRRLGSLRSRLE
ncbi:MAG: NYN domain-containing protein [Verrucomicrobiota bacterium]